MPSYRWTFFPADPGEGKPLIVCERGNRLDVADDAYSRLHTGV